MHQSLKILNQNANPNPWNKKSNNVWWILYYLGQKMHELMIRKQKRETGYEEEEKDNHTN